VQSFDFVIGVTILTTLGQTLLVRADQSAFRRTSASRSTGDAATLRPIAEATSPEVNMTTVMARCRPKRSAASLPKTLACRQCN
jgi:hypothetical protein